MSGYPVKDYFVIGVENLYPLREQGLPVSILRRVVDSEELRRWLEPLIHEKKQAGAGKWLGVAQSTINRIVNQDAYDFPLNTVVSIAAKLGYRRLSDFFLHLENNLSAPLQMTSSDHVISDKTSPTPHTSREIETHASHPSALSEADIQRIVRREVPKFIRREAKALFNTARQTETARSHRKVSESRTQKPEGRKRRA